MTGTSNGSDSQRPGRSLCELLECETATLALFGPLFPRHTAARERRVVVERLTSEEQRGLRDASRHEISERLFVGSRDAAVHVDARANACIRFARGDRDQSA